MNAHARFLKRKNAEQISAEVKVASMIMEATTKKADELKQFLFQGKRYRPIVAKIHIPNIGERTALEICVDKDAQSYLVKEGCVGSVIEEIK